METEINRELQKWYGLLIEQTFSCGVEQNTQRYKKQRQPILLLHSGDFIQTLAVIPRSTYVSENIATHRKYYRIDPSADTFSNQLLDIADGKVTIYENTGMLKFAH